MLNLLFLFIIGTVVGSFLNVCIHRLPKEESIIWPASHCPACQQRLHFFDLIPLLSYLMLRGRCRYCQAGISWRYPLVELLSGLLFVLAGYKFAWLSLPFFFALVFSALLLVIIFTDFEKMLISDGVCFIGLFCGLGYNFLKTSSWSVQTIILSPFVSACLGVAVGFGLLYLIGFCGKLWFKQDAMGEGDYYLGAMLGAFLGWRDVVLAIFLAYFIAGIVTLFLLGLRRLKFGDYVPFGPALALGGLLTYYFGQELISWYLRLVFGL